MNIVLIISIKRQIYILLSTIQMRTSQSFTKLRIRQVCIEATICVTQSKVMHQMEGHFMLYNIDLALLLQYGKL